MKKIFIVLFFLLKIILLLSQPYVDSVWYRGEYIPLSEYEIRKKEYEQKNFSTYFMPGLAFKYYIPNNRDSIGAFRGITIEYIIFAKVEQNDNPGPSHVRIYAKLNILKNTKSNISPLLMYVLGIDLSLEKNPNRTYLIPYFGLEFGGISQKQYVSTVQFTPIVGVHLLSRKNLFINIHAGYMYPLKNFELLHGSVAQASINFALW